MMGRGVVVQKSFPRELPTSLTCKFIWFNSSVSMAGKQMVANLIKQKKVVMISKVGII